VTGDDEAGAPRLLIDPRNGRTRPATEATSLPDIKFFKRSFAQSFRIPDATLRKLNDFSGDNLSHWVATIRQSQPFAYTHERSGHIVNRLRFESLADKKWRNRHNLHTLP
jgi:hypothetical protein